MLYFHCLFFIEVLITYIENVENLSNRSSSLESQMLNYGVREARLGFKKEWIPVTLCKSGMPLLRSKMCNGKVDCHDGSDETSELCKSNRCQNDQFRCDYGGCISRVFTCDGAYNCADGSDEKRSTCKMNNCVLPHSTKNTVYFVPECQECRAGARVEEGSILQYQCLDNNAKQETELQDVVCRSSKWVPFVPKCNGNEPVDTDEGVRVSTTTQKQGANLQLTTAVTGNASASKIETTSATTVLTTPAPT